MLILLSFLVIVVMSHVHVHLLVWTCVVASTSRESATVPSHWCCDETRAVR